MKRILLLCTFVFAISLTAQQTKIDSLNAKLKITKNEDTIIDLHEKIIGLYMSSNKIDEANSYLKKLTYKSKSNKNLLALSYKLKGKILQYTNKLDSSLIINYKAIEVLKNTKPNKIAADVYLNIGNCLLDLNKMDSIPYYYNKASEIYYKLNNYRGLCFLYYNSASYYLRINKNFECEKSLNKLIKYNKIFKNDFFDAKAYYMLGILNTQISNYEIGIEYLVKSVESFNKIGNYFETGITLMTLASTYGDNNNIIESEKAFQRAILLFHEKAIPKNLVFNFLLINYVDVLIKRNNFKEAQKQLNLVKLYAKQNENEFENIKPFLITNQAEIFTHNNKLIEAFQSLNNIDTTNLLPEFKIAYYRAQVNLNTKNKNFKKAMEYNKAYFYIKDSFQNSRIKNQLVYTNTKFETEKKETENLKLKAEKAKQQVILENEKNQKWLFGSGLATSIFILIIGGHFYQKNKKQKDVIVGLQKELHHRIKNNLAIINTFIDVAKEEFSDIAFNNELTDLQNRIASINEVHQQLYKNTDVTSLSVQKYVQKLTDNIRHSFANENVVITQNINDSLKLNAEQSFAVGLIINEFLTNSFKYAFDNNNGTILIELKEDPQNIHLTLSDNGKGLPQDFDIQKTETFGLRVIKLLALQLKGSFNFETKNGVTLKIHF